MQHSGPRATHYQLGITVDYTDNQLHGDCVVCIINEGRAAIRTVPLLLYRLLDVTKIECGQATVAFTQSIEPFTDWDSLRVNAVMVRLPAALQAGGTAILHIYYQGKLAGYTETGMRYVKDAIERTFTIIRPDCFAYPVIGKPVMHALRVGIAQGFDYDLKVTVPRPLVVANGGTMVGIERNGSQRTYHFRNTEPAWRIDAAIADYRTLTDPSGRLQVYCFKQDYIGGKKVLRALQRCLRLYNEWFGPLRAFRGFSVIELPSGYGSQADRTCIMQTANAFRDEGSLIELFHELSHLWNVSPLDKYPCRIESEGLATFLQGLAACELTNDPQGLERNMRGCRASVRRQIKREPWIIDIAPIDYGRRSLTGLSYSYGAALFGELYKIVGHDTFVKIVGTLHAKYRHSGLTTTEFMQYINKHVAINLREFWQDWLLSNAAIKRMVHPQPVPAMRRRAA